MCVCVCVCFDPNKYQIRLLNVVYTRALDVSTTIVFSVKIITGTVVVALVNYLVFSSSCWGIFVGVYYSVEK